MWLRPTAALCSWRFIHSLRCSKALKTPPHIFERLWWRPVRHGSSTGRGTWLIRGVFASHKFFSFSHGAKLGEFRPTLPAQVVCGSPVVAWGWGETVGISPRGWCKTLSWWGETRQELRGWRLRCPKLPTHAFGRLMRFWFVQSLQFAAVTGAQNSLMWVLRICRILDTFFQGASWRAAVAHTVG
jgi:hypothetical protein